MSLRQRGYLIEGERAKKIWHDFVGGWYPGMSEKETRKEIAKSKAEYKKRAQAGVSPQSLDAKKKDVFWANKLAGDGSTKADNVSRGLENKADKIKKNWKKMKPDSVKSSRKILGDIVDQLDGIIGLLKHVR